MSILFFYEAEGKNCEYFKHTGNKGLAFIPSYNTIYAFVIGPYLIEFFRTWMIYNYSYALNMMYVDEEALNKNKFVKYIFLLKNKWMVIELSLLIIMPFLLSAIGAIINDTCEHIWFVHIIPFIIYISGFTFLSIKMRRIQDGFKIRKEYIFTGILLIFAFIINSIMASLDKDKDGMIVNIPVRSSIYIFTIPIIFVRLTLPIYNTYKWINTESTTSSSEEYNCKITDIKWLEKRLDDENIRINMVKYFDKKLLTLYAVFYNKLLEAEKHTERAVGYLYLIWGRFLKLDALYYLDGIINNEKQDSVAAELRTFENWNHDTDDKSWTSEKALLIIKQLKERTLNIFKEVMLNESDRSILKPLISTFKLQNV